MDGIRIVDSAFISKQQLIISSSVLYGYDGILSLVVPVREEPEPKRTVRARPVPSPPHDTYMICITIVLVLVSFVCVCVWCAAWWCGSLLSLTYKLDVGSVANLDFLYVEKLE